MIWWYIILVYRRPGITKYVYCSCTSMHVKTFHKTEITSKRTFFQFWRLAFTSTTSPPPFQMHWYCTCVHFHLNEAQINPHGLCTCWTTQMNHDLLQISYTHESWHDMWPCGQKLAAVSTTEACLYHSHHAANCNLEAITETIYESSSSSFCVLMP